ncbi:MAG TPA: hypothetical protein VD996_08635 [Chitinophagaceae bacterium]|nr:hypothetical protein [Chitinophagaceae bacterium]
MTQKLLAVILVVLMTGCKKDDDDKDIIVIESSGNINTGVNAFRQLLGNTLNTTPGATGGRREVNWDAVPVELLGKPLPPHFLNNTDADAPASQQRGFEYEGIAAFQVSNSNFSEVNPQAAPSFATFSGSNSFTNTSTVLWDGSFEIPGQNVPASVSGFGMVFSDVDLANTSFIEFFNGDRSLGKFYVPVQKAGSKLSFLGVYFKKERVTRIKVQHGNGVLNQGEKDISDGGSKDLVILDDFLYDEPVKK